MSQGKAPIAAVALQVVPGAPGLLIDGGGGPTLGANAAALSASSGTRARPAACKDNDPAVFSAPPIVQTPDAAF